MVHVSMHEHQANAIVEQLTRVTLRLGGSILSWEALDEEVTVTGVHLEGFRLRCQ